MDKKSKPYISFNSKRIALGEDSTLFRVFTINEITETLLDSGFEILEIINRETYAFDTNVYVCRKKE